MKIFVSYGHDHNEPLVDNVIETLKSSGHEVWDDSAIRVGDDWRREIVNGLLDTQWTLAFLSRHSTRDPGVCLDELAIALHVKGGTIATVLVEAEADVRPPVSLTHIQWLDMSDWEKRARAGGIEWKVWYEEKLRTILNLVAGPPAIQFAGEITELERRLDPISQHAAIGELVEGFVERPWLLERLETWRTHPRPERVFCLTGDPGSGKSAFAAWIAHYGRANVISLYLCDYFNEDRRDSRKILQTLAFQLATRIPDYRALLIKKLDQCPEDELARKNLVALFDWILAEPLSLCLDGGRRLDRYVIVVDGLDETIRDGRSDMAELLARSAKQLPAWMGLMVTSRPEAPILRVFAGMNQCAIERASTETRGDLHRYTEIWLGEEDRERTNRIVQAADGNFQYLRKLREAVEQRGLFELDSPEGLPAGLHGLYERWFRRQFPDRSDYERHYRRLIDVLVACHNPIPEDLLAEIFRWSLRDKTYHLQALGGLFDRRVEGIAPFHKSLRDWLLDDRASGGDFVADMTAGANLLFGVLWGRLLSSATIASSEIPDSFLLAELPIQVGRRPGQTLQSDLNGVNWEGLFALISRIAESLESGFSWLKALAWWRMCASLADAWRNRGSELEIVKNKEAASAWRRALTRLVADSSPSAAVRAGESAVATAKMREGNILRTLGDSNAALAAYRTSHDILNLLAQKESGDPAWMRELSVLNSHIADVLRSQGDSQGALEALQSSNEISGRLAQRHRGNAVLQHDVGSSNDRMGDILLARGNLADALAAYRASLASAERLVRKEPSNAVFQRALSISHLKIGDVLSRQGDLASALAAFQTSFKIDERLMHFDSGSAEFRRDAAITLGRIAGALEGLGDLTASLAAFQQVLDIQNALIRQDPANATWQRDLSVTHNNIGRILCDQNDWTAALTAFSAGLKAIERLARLDSGNATWQRDLAVSNHRIGDVRMAQHDVQGALAAFRVSLAIEKELARKDPKNASVQREMSVSHIKIGDALSALNDPSHALAAYRESHEIITRLVRSDPTNGEWQSNLAASHERIGIALLSQGEPKTALAEFRACLKISAALVERNPGNPEWQRGLSISYGQIGEALSSLGNLTDAVAAFRTRLDINARLCHLNPRNPEWQRALAFSHFGLGRVLGPQGDIQGGVRHFRQCYSILRDMRDVGTKLDPDAEQLLGILEEGERRFDMERK